MILEICKYGDPVLDRTAERVTEFDEGLRRLVADMFETMYAAPGVGLAAPQVGVSKRLFVMDCSSGRKPEERVVLVNPEILLTEGLETGDEGCLSFPGIYFQLDDLTVPEKYRGIGVRIEDDVLVTETGYDNLSAHIPTDPDEVERWMAEVWARSDAPKPAEAR